MDPYTFRVATQPPHIKLCPQETTQESYSSERRKSRKKMPIWLCLTRDFRGPYDKDYNALGYVMGTLLVCENPKYTPRIALQEKHANRLTLNPSSRACFCAAG